MLIDEQDRDIFAIPREAVERVFNDRGFRLCVDDEEVLLRIRRCGDMLSSFVSLVCAVTAGEDILRRRPEAVQSPSPIPR